MMIEGTYWHLNWSHPVSLWVLKGKIKCDLLRCLPYLQYILIPERKLWVMSRWHRGLILLLIKLVCGNHSFKALESCFAVGISVSRWACLCVVDRSMDVRVCVWLAAISCGQNNLSTKIQTQQHCKPQRRISSLQVFVKVPKVMCEQSCLCTCVSKSWASYFQNVKSKMGL